VLEKAGEEQLDRSCEKSFTKKTERDNLRTIKRRNVNWIGHILRRNCLLTHATEGKTEKKVTGRRGRRRKQVLDNLKGKKEDTGN
jgi:hypothetical protein